MARNTTPRRYPAKHDKSGTSGCARVRRACLWHPNVAGCRYALAGLVARDGTLVAAWAGAPGVSEVRL